MDDLERLYAVRFPEAARTRKDRVWSVICSDFFQRYVAADATVLELGSGFGEFSRHIEARRKIAVDLNARAGAHLPPDIEFHPCSAEDLSAVASESVDVCFSSNFFEHLPSKESLDRVLQEARRVLKPGGRYVALQPNLRYAPGEYWDFYDHVIPLTHLSCAEAFAKAGFEIVEVIDRFLPFSTRSRLPQSPWLVRLYLAVPLAWRILGRQFLIVARKPAGALRATGEDGAS